MLIKGIKTGRDIPLRNVVGAALHNYDAMGGGYERLVELAEDRAGKWAIEFEQKLWDATESYTAGFIEGYLMAKLEGSE